MFSIWQHSWRRTTEGISLFVTGSSTFLIHLPPAFAFHGRNNLHFVLRVK